jgi:hypothetical protein
MEVLLRLNNTHDYMAYVIYSTFTMFISVAVTLGQECQFQWTTCIFGNLRLVFFKWVFPL